MNPRSHGPLAALLLLLPACASKPTPTPAAPPEDVASPGPEQSAEPTANPTTEPTTPPVAARAPEPPPAPAVWDKELERQTLPKGHGTAVLGVSTCDDGFRSLLVKRELKGKEPQQVEFDRFVGCEVTRDGKGWSSTVSSDGEAVTTRFQLASVVLDPSTVAVFLNVIEGSDDAIVVSQGDKFDRFDFGRLSDSTTDTVLSPPGELSRIVRADGRGDFMWYDAYAVRVDPEAGLKEVSRDIWLARPLVADSYEAATAAKSALVSRCSRHEARIALLEVHLDDGGTRFWVGIPGLSRADAQSGVRDLANCGQKATVETRKAQVP